MSPNMKRCLDACRTCYESCTSTEVHCIEMGGPHAGPNHLRTMKDCALACFVSADFMLRQSRFSAMACQACATICDACAQDCERFQDDFMRQCARTCRDCAAACREMA